MFHDEVVTASRSGRQKFSYARNITKDVPCEYTDGLWLLRGSQMTNADVVSCAFNFAAPDTNSREKIC
jgi:hypothetical protein